MIWATWFLLGVIVGIFVGSLIVMVAFLLKDAHQQIEKKQMDEK